MKIKHIKISKLKKKLSVNFWAKLLYTFIATLTYLFKFYTVELA